MAETTPPAIQSPLIGDTVNPLIKQNSEYIMPELPNAPIYKGPSTNQVSTSESKTLFGDRMKGMLQTVKDIPKWAGDDTPYGKVFNYDADYTGANFQRYYNHSKFQELGFSPFRDNETLYNKTGSWADDAGRMLRGWSSLFATGAYDGVKSWTDNPFNPEADTDTAGDMDRKMSQMTSSKGGFGGGVINFGANTAYSMGLVTEFMAETAILAAATAVTFGADIEVTAPLEAARAATLASKLANAGKAMSNTYKTLTSLKDINTAKNFFKSAVSGENMSRALNFINPLENTTRFIKDAAKANKAGEQIYNMAKASKGFGSFLKDVRQTQMVMSESNLEGGFVSNEMVKSLTDEFYSEKGRMPNSSEAADIYKTAGVAGNKTIMWNMPALFLSNKIVFENAFKGFKPMHMLAAESSEGLAGKLVFNKAWKAAGANPWSVVEDGFKNSLKSLTKASTWNPVNLGKNLLTKGVGYTSKNLTEAFQEQYQEAVSMSMHTYYKNLYEDPSKAGSDSMGSIFSDNLAKQFTTAQGFETFASGFFMGGVLQGPQKLIFEKIPQKIFKMKNPEQYAERQKQKQEWTNSVVESLNEVTKDPAKYFNAVSENMVIQRKTGYAMREANDHNDEKAFKDATDESVFNHLHTLVSSGKFDLIMEHLNEMKQLSPKELEEAFGKAPNDNTSYHSDKIDSMIDKANYIKKRTDAVNELFVNPFNPYKYNPGKDTKNYVAEQIRWRAYEDSKKAAVYSSFSFDRTLERMQSVISDVTNDLPIGKANTSDFTILFERKSMDSEIEALRVEVGAFSVGTPAQKTQARQSLKKKEALEELRDDIDSYRKILQNKPYTDKDKGLTLNQTIDKLNKSYKSYLKTIATISNDHVFDNKVTDSFVKLKDYYQLESDSDNLSNTINFLHNPSSFVTYSKRMEEIRKSLYEKRGEHAKAGFEAYLKMQDQNELLNQLLEDGVYVHPDDIKALVENKIIPKELFDVINYEELTPDSDKYKKGLESITKWIEATKPIVEQTPEELEIETRRAAELLSASNNNWTEDESKINAKYDAELAALKAKPIVEKGVEKITVVDTTQVKIKGTTPIVDMPSDLVDSLVESFNAYNRSRISNDEGALAGFKENNTKEQTLSLTSFNSYIKTFSTAAKVISDYNTKHNRTIEPVKTEPVKGAKPVVPTTSAIVTTDMKQQLSDLGYTAEDIAKMRPAQANHIISGSVAKQVTPLTPEEDIERRREFSLNNIDKGKNDTAQTGTYYPKGFNTSMSGTIMGPYDYDKDDKGTIKTTEEKEERKKDSDTERLKEWINSKYDAELAALKTNPEALKSIEDMFKDATTMEEVEGAEEEVIAMLADAETRRKIGLTNEFLMNLVESRKRELATSFTYESINKGDVLIMENNAKMLVVEKSDTELKLRKLGDETGENNINVPKALVATTVKYKYKEGMEDVIINKPVTPEEAAVSDASVKAFVEFNEDDDSDAVDEDIKKAKSLSKDDRDNDLKTILGCP